MGGAAEQAIAERALALPEAYVEHPWGISAFKVPGGKVFCFASVGDEPARATVKLLAEDREIALSMPFVRVASHVGRYGWVTVEAIDEHALAAALDWIVDSYWLRASAALREQLEQSPFWAEV